MESDRVPEHEIGVLDGAVSARPAREAVTAFALVGVHPCRIALGAIMGSHPQVMIGEAGATLGMIISAKQRDRIGTWSQLIADSVPERP